MSAKPTRRTFLTALPLATVPGLAVWGASSADQGQSFASGHGIIEPMSTFSWARRHARAVMWSGGVMLMLLGVLQVTGLWMQLTSRLPGVIANWQVPL